MEEVQGEAPGHAGKLLVRARKTTSTEGSYILVSRRAIRKIPEVMLH